MYYALKNKVQLIGHVGRQPEVRVTDKGRKWARFSLATSEIYENASGEKVTETQWHNLVAWGNLAETIEKFVPSGKEIAVEGKLVHRSYVNKEGIKTYVTEVQIAELLLLGKNN